MSVFSAARPSDDESKGKVHQLLDIIAEEVSDVDRAANRRTYLIVKRRTDMDPNAKNLGPEVVDGPDGTLKTVRKSDDKPSEESTTSTEKQALTIPKAVKQALLQTTTQNLQRLTTLVEALKGAEETDEKLDQPTPDSIARELRGISQQLLGALERYPSPIVKDAASQEPTDVAKAGAKLATKRRDQLKSVIDLLQKLLGEVMPEKADPRGAAPGDRNTDPNRANVGSGVQPDKDAARSARETMSDVPGLADVLKSLTSLSEVMKELRSQVQGQDEDIARLRKSTGLPASREVESVPRPKPAEPVSWPLDMNRPLTRDKVAKEVSFFE